MAINPVTGKRGPGRLPNHMRSPQLPPMPAPVTERKAASETLASMIGAQFDQRAPADGIAPPAYEVLPPTLGILPSEQVAPDPEPQVGAPGQRQPLHETSDSGMAALAAGFGGPSADTPVEPAPAEATFRRDPMQKRVPFGVREQRMSWPPIPGFHLHWFNDEPGRIRRAEAAGYQPVTAQGRPVTQIVGTDRSGKPLAAFLMKIPEAYFTEDMAAIEHEQQQILGAIRGGKFQAGENTYVPKQGISLRNTVERR